MDIVATVFFGLLGAAIGSFLNVAIDRLPRGKSIISPPSHCDGCGRRIARRDLVPILSYLALRGRCRYCQARIPGRVPLVELGTGLFLAFSYWHYGLSTAFALNSFYFCLFLVLAVIDIDHGLILNKLVYPAAVIVLVISIFLSEPGIINAVVGGAVGFGMLLVAALVSRGGMGWGDVKMAGLIGLATGFPLVFVAILAGVIVGGVLAALLLLARKKSRKESIAFGPFLSIGTMVALLWGENILGWYTSLYSW